jgi:hypothetical protein
MVNKNPQRETDDCGRNPKVAALYTDIGRGHPSYLDSLLSVLRQSYPDLACRTVFQESKGLSLLAWRFVSWLYSISGKGGIHTRFYNFIRRRSQKGSKDSVAARILGRDLRRAFEEFGGICLVAHPLVARALADVCRVWYVHGEIAAPVECAIRGVEKILVPLDETKNKLVAHGADEQAVLVCGLMIEPWLVQGAEKAYRERLERIKSDRPLTIGFFTSGAYPKEHMEKIVLGAESVVRQQMKAFIFCGTRTDKFEWVKKRLSSLKAKTVEDDGRSSPEDDDFDLMVVTRKTRQEDTERAVELIPRLDAFVAASHERTNYAVGLGLPMFVLFPLIGTFARQNFEFAQKQGVVYAVESSGKAKNLGQLLTELRQDGRLIEMSQDGFGVHEIRGVETGLHHLLKNTSVGGP